MRTRSTSNAAVTTRSSRSPRRSGRLWAGFLPSVEPRRCEIRSGFMESYVPDGGIYLNAQYSVRQKYWPHLIGRKHTPIYAADRSTLAAAPLREDPLRL